MKGKKCKQYFCFELSRSLSLSAFMQAHTNTHSHCQSSSSYKHFGSLTTKRTYTTNEHTIARTYVPRAEKQNRISRVEDEKKNKNQIQNLYAKFLRKTREIHRKPYTFCYHATVRCCNVLVL